METKVLISRVAIKSNWAHVLVFSKGRHSYNAVHLMLLLYITNRTYVLFMGVFPNSWYFKPIFALPRDIWTVKTRMEYRKKVINESRNKKSLQCAGQHLILYACRNAKSIYTVYDVLLTCSLYLSYAIYVFMLKKLFYGWILLCIVLIVLKIFGFATK